MSQGCSECCGVERYLELSAVFEDGCHRFVGDSVAAGEVENRQRGTVGDLTKGHVGQRRATEEVDVGERGAATEEGGK